MGELGHYHVGGTTAFFYLRIICGYVMLANIKQSVMSKQAVSKLIQYWQTVAHQSYKTMNVLYKNKRYSDALFYSHLTLEKLLKGLTTKTLKKSPPYTHDLVLLARLSKLNFTEQELEFFELVNQFNIRARYDDYKLSFYKKCNKHYTEAQLNKIRKTYNQLLKYV